MNRLPLLSLLASLAVLLSGCEPEERFWWSPQGDRAVVEVDDNLYLVTVDSELGEPLPLQGTAEGSISSVDWLPDGSGILVCRQREVATWSEVKQLVPRGETQRVEQLMVAMIPMLEWRAGLSEPPEGSDPFGGLLSEDSGSAAMAAVLALRESEPSRIDELLRKLPDGGDTAESLAGTPFHVSELCLVRLDGESGPEVNSRLRSLEDQFPVARFSPTQPAIALVRQRSESSSLEVLSIRDDSSLTVATSATTALDWTPDGLSLVYASRDGEGPIHSIDRATVLQASGELMKPRRDDEDVHNEEPNQLDGPTSLASVVLSYPFRLGVLPDGRTLVASRPLAFPAPAESSEPGPAARLYLVAADGSAIESVATGPGQLPNDLTFFDLSPDGQRVAFWDEDSDAVAVLELSTGAVTGVSPAHERWTSQVMPAWKSSTELSFAGLDEASSSPRWMLWSAESGISCISSKWPSAATGGWMTRSEDSKEGEGGAEEP